MTEDKHKRQVPRPPDIRVRNTRYEGATPEQVALALTRHRIDKLEKTEHKET